MAVIFRYVVLLYLHRDAPPDQAWHAAAAQSARVQATVVLAQAYEESRYQRGAVSRGKFCGVLQLKSTSERDCQRICADVAGSYRAAVRHLEAWLDFCHERMPCALAGYGGGTKAARGRYPGGRAERYAKRVLRRAFTAPRPPRPRGTASARVLTSS